MRCDSQIRHLWFTVVIKVIIFKYRVKLKCCNGNIYELFKRNCLRQLKQLKSNL